MTEMIPKVLRCLLTEDPETGRWNGHCLEFDLATSGIDPDQAWNNLRAVVRLHVENCFTHWQEGLKFRASAEEVALFELLKKQEQPFRSEKITFNLVPPQRPEELLAPLWIQGIELEQGANTGVPRIPALQ
jgi:hypothetical protein